MYQRQTEKKEGLLIPITIDNYIHSTTDNEYATTIRKMVVGDFIDWENEKKFEKALSELITALNVNRGDIQPPSFL